MLGGDFPKRRARCTTARSSAARFTARPRLTRPRSCMRKESSFTRCPCCRTSGTDRGLTSTWSWPMHHMRFFDARITSRHPSARTARTRPRADGRVPGQSGRGRIPDICRSYHWHKITEERFMMDEPSGVRNDQTETSVDGAQLLAFHGFDAVMGQTYEVWFIKGDSLYESPYTKSSNLGSKAIYINP